MSGYDFSFCSVDLRAEASGALWWEEAQLLTVSDLHLGKSERMARRGGALLPPYETRETLTRLSGEIARLDPRTVICLGDSFDDLSAQSALDDVDHAELAAMMAGRRWIWIEGNHDAGPIEIGGSHHDEIERGPLTFRHIARPGRVEGEISGHYHPKHVLNARGRTVSRPCFLIGDGRLILPAFGVYTGGLRSELKMLRQLTGPNSLAVLTGKTATPVPL